MPTLAHLNLRTTQLSAVVDFYVRVLGFRSGIAETRPDSPAYVWLYDSAGVPSLHVQGDTTLEPVGDAVRRAGFHHLALACDDAAAWVERLTRLDVPFEHRQLPAGIAQINLRDPDGLLVELTFGGEDLTLPPLGEFAGPTAD